MATIPSVADQLPSVPRATGGIAQIGVSPVGQAVAGLGDKLAQIAGQEVEKQDQFAYAKARADFLSKKTDLESSFQNDQDWATLPKRYADGIKQIANDAAANLPTQNLKEQFGATVAIDAAEGMSRVRAFSNGLRQDQGKADMNQLLTDTRDKALSDPANAKAYLDNADLAIRGARAQNFISAQEEQKARETFTTDYGKGYLETLDPDSRVRVLSQSLGIGTSTQSQGNIKSALIGQESGGNPNAPDSPTGAMGIGQIEPATWARFAKPGEDPHNPKDSAAVSGRIVDYLSALPNVQGDPARIAVGYYSGEGNIAPSGSAAPYIRDASPRAGVKGPKVSQYVSSVLSRMAPPAGATLDTAPAKTGTPADFVPPDERHVMLEQAIRQRHADTQIALETQKAAQSLQDRDTANQLMDDIYSGKATTQAIIKSNLPAFGENSKNELLDVASKIKTGVTDPAVWQGLYERIALPSGDPRKITNEAELRASVGNGLSFDDYRKFSSLLGSNDTEEGRTLNDMRKQAYDIAKSVLVKASPVSGLFDPNDAIGRQKLLIWSNAAALKEADAIKNHKPLTDLYDPNSPNYVLRILPKPPSIDDAMSQQSFSPPPLPQKSAAQMPKRNPGETPEQFLHRIGAIK